MAVSGAVRGLRVNLHTHSLVSDGTDTPAELVEKAKLAGLHVVALTDHDNFLGLAQAAAAGLSHGVEIVSGIEMSTNFAGRPLHLLGYGCRLDDQDLNAELAKMVAARTQRVPTMLQLLADLDMPIDSEVIARHAQHAKAVGRPHIADAMVELGYVPDRTTAFQHFLAAGGPAYVERYTTDIATAISLIQAAGGVAVLAHGLDGGRGQDLRDADFVELIETHGLDGLEIDHPMHDQDQRSQLRAIASEYQRIESGGSDYHGTGKVGHDIGQEMTDPQQYQRLLELIAVRGGQAFARP